MSYCHCHHHNNDSCEHNHEGHDHNHGSFVSQYWNTIFSFVVLAIGLLLQWLGVNWFVDKSIRFIWYFVAYLPVGYPVIKEALSGIKRHSYTTEFTLMTIATIGAFAIGEYPEAVAVMLFYTFGESLQDKAVGSARRNIQSLLDVRVKEATVKRDGVISTISPLKVSVGEILRVKVGERVALDGILLSDKATFNTSALTGESLPRTIKSGEEVLSGMIVMDKVVEIRTSKTYRESTLSQILDMVENATKQKSPVELFVHRFADVYTKIVMFLSVLIVLVPFLYSLIVVSFSFDFSSWFYRALVFLVISCPCALVVSIPLGYFGGIGVASRMGILFKGGAYLDIVSKIKTVVFDKTGTLTKGDFEVKQCNIIEGFDKKEFLTILYGLESHSTHPIALAVNKYVRSMDIPMLQIKNIEEVAGLGIKSDNDNNCYLLGNIGLLDKYNIKYPEALNAIKETLIILVRDGLYLGYITLSDTIKEDAVDAIQQLRKEGVEYIHILSGDREKIVKQVGDELGVDEATGDLLPQDKVEYLQQILKEKKKNIAFVGDGINDAPVLVLADLGVAMGGLGSDMAIESADVVIQSDHPSKLATAIHIGKTTKKIIWQNICFAFAIKILVLLLGALGYPLLWEAVFADVGVALIAILNVLRIERLIKN